MHDDASPPDTHARRRGEAPASDDLSAILASAQRAHERRLADERAAVEPDQRFRAAAERARHLADRAALLLASGFGAHEVDRCRADDPGTTPALAAARAFVAQHERPILVLLGGVGTGKTSAATWIAREVGGSRPGKVMATVLERRGRYDRDRADGERPLMAWLEERTLVVLDDLGVEPIDGKGYFAALVDELVDRAYSHRRRLVITSNCSSGVLRERLGERVASRLNDAGGSAVTVDCGAVDLRRAGKVLSLGGRR